MDDKKILTINKLDGSTEDVEVVISFQFNDTKKQYVVYTKNETDEAGNMTIYVTEMVKDAMGTHFVGIENDEEWAKVKEALRELAKDEEN